MLPIFMANVVKQDNLSLNFWIFINIWQIGGRFLFLSDVSMTAGLRMMENWEISYLHQFENSPKCKFVHCTTMWKIKALPRGKAGTSWE